MKTPEEVLKAWDCCREDRIDCKNCPYGRENRMDATYECEGRSDYEGGIYADVRAALEKQVAKRIVVENTVCSTATNSFSKNICPSCNGRVLTSGSGNCQRCGQRLDWTIGE